MSDPDPETFISANNIPVAYPVEVTDEDRERWRPVAARHARQTKRAEFRDRCKSVQEAAITVAVLVGAVLFVAVAYELWRILREVTP